MSAIFCIYLFDSYRSVDRSLIKECTDLMSHRGPDASGYYVDSNVGLGHRRLSIIDLACGNQPMTNEDGQIVIVFDGEIYNYREIRRSLSSKGHIFRTDSDAEVIVHAYEELGTECVHQFNGMFAFVLWDKRTKKLWVVRDRLGIKPLYYYQDTEVFICGSEIKSILKTGLIKSELNENVLDAYFSVGYVPGPETMFKRIKKTLPGHFLLVDGIDVTDHEYWDFADVHPLEVSFSEAMEQVNGLLVDSVHKQLMSDVPLGCLLSGGLDSSVIASIVSEAVGETLNVFTLSYRKGFSEEEYAKIVAQKLSCKHHVFYLEAKKFFLSLQTLVQYAEEPIVEPAAIALYHVAKLAREHAIVLLSGEGSEELFAGANLHRVMLSINKAQVFIPWFVLSNLRVISQQLPKYKYRKYVDWLSSPLASRFQGTSSYLTPTLKKQIYSADFLAGKTHYLEEQFSMLFNKVKHRTPLFKMLYVNTKTWLVDDLLLKAEKMTMAASVELRFPFLDYRLVEMASRLPDAYKIKNGTGKFILKKIAERLLPSEIVYRKKMGFPVPTEDWFKGELLADIKEIVAELKKEPWFNSMALDDLMSRHEAGIEDHSKILMTLLVFEEWRRQYV